MILTTFRVASELGCLWWTEFISWREFRCKEVEKAMTERTSLVVFGDVKILHCSGYSLAELYIPEALHTFWLPDTIFSSGTIIVSKRDKSIYSNATR